MDSDTKRADYPKPSQCHCSFSEGLHRNGEDSEGEPHGVEDGDSSKSLRIFKMYISETILQH